MADAKKVTKKEYFAALRALVEDMDGVGDYTVDEVIEFIDSQVAQIDKKNAKAKETAAKKAAESDALTDKIYDCVTDEFQTADAITDAIADETVTKSKVVARLSKLIKTGKVVKETIKVGDAKKVAYKLAEVDEDAENVQPDAE